MQLYMDYEHRVTKINSTNPLETQELGIEVGKLLRNSNPSLYQSVKPYLLTKNGNIVSQARPIEHLASLSPDDTQGLAKIDIWSKSKPSEHQNYMLEINTRSDRSPCESCDLDTDEIYRLRAISEWTKLGIVQLNHRWDMTYSNHAFAEQCHLEHGNIQGQDWLSAVHENDRENLINQLHQSMHKKCRSKFEIRLKNSAGISTWVNLQCSPIFDFLNRFVGFVLIFIDINDKHEAQEKLLELAHIDSLTGLYNRHAFIEKMIDTFSIQRDRNDFAILFIDLDGFKDINDGLGHAAGDLLLNKVAQRIAKTLRQNDIVARLGGDEFAVLLQNISGTLNAEQVAIKLLDVISMPYYLNDDDKESFVSASVGISLAESVTESIDYSNKNELREITDQLLRCADAAMYRAKRAGRNTFRFHEKLMDAESTQMMTISVALHHAIKNNEFELHYQPQFDWRTGKLYGYEALLRWNHPEFGKLGPETYLPIIERSGMVHDIGKWIITQAIRDHAQYIKSTGQKNIRLSINLSATQFRDQQLLPTFRQLLKTYKVAPETVTVEITETVLMDSYAEIKKDLEAMSELGLSIALDDFGTGYSSLSYLQRFPIQIIKIDQSFVQNIDQHESRMITEAIVKLAQSLNKQVIAEGVETSRELNTLIGFGCHLFQGWYFDQAMSIKQIINNHSTAELTEKAQGNI